MGQLEVSNECFKLMISPPLPNLFQVYDSDCCDSILLELREYLPKYFGVWSPPTAPNGTVLILSVNPNPLEKFSGDCFLAVASSAGVFLVLLCNPLTFPLTTGPICSLLAGLGPWGHPGESQALRECVRKGKWRGCAQGEVFQLEGAAESPEVGSHGHATSCKAVISTGTLLGSALLGILSYWFEWNKAPLS